MIVDDRDVELWGRLKCAFRDYVVQRIDFMKNPSAISLIQKAFGVPEDRALAIELVSLYPNEDRIVFFRQLISMASYVNGFTEECRDLILDLPRDWVMGNIEFEIEKILIDGGYEEYRCLLELCYKLDKNLMTMLARRALDSSDEDIKEAGEDFLYR